MSVRFPIFALILAVAVQFSCTKAPQPNQRSSYNCDSNPEDCNGGVESDSSSLTVQVPDAHGQVHESFKVSWTYPGATNFDVAISKDETCTDKDKLEIELLSLLTNSQEFKLTKPGIFYVCVSAKDSNGRLLAKKTGIKFEVKGESIDTSTFVAASNLRISADSAVSSAHSASDDDTTIYFLWDPATDSSYSIKSYTLSYYTAANCNGTALSVENLTTASYALTSAVYTATYSFKVTAINSEGWQKESDCSQSITINYPVHTITFDTAGNYTYDNTLLSVSGGVAVLLALNQTYDDNTSAEFGMTNAHNNTTWDSDHVELKNAGSPDPRPLPNDFYHGVDASGMQLLVHFDDAYIAHADTLYDDLGHHFTAVLGGGNKSVKGKHGRALDFGVGGYFSQSHSSDFDMTQYSIICWIKTTDSTAGLMAKSSTSTNFSGSIVSGKLKLEATVDGNSSTVSVTGNQSIDDGKWHFYAMVASASHLYIYVDGKLDNSSPYTGTIDTPATSLAHANTYAGNADELAIFSRALSATEIATLYQNQVKNFTHEHWPEVPGLMDGNVVLLHMDDASGNLVDYSGAGNDATATEAPTSYGATGKVGSAINFGGAGYFSFASTLELSGGPATYMFWTNEHMGGSSGPAEDSFFNRSGGLDFIVSDNGIDTLRINKNGTGSLSTSAGLFSDSQWHHIAITDDGSTTKIFVDGREEASTNLSLAFDVDEIGRYSTWRLEGSMDEVGIWRRALSPQEIQTVYNLQSGNYRGNVHELPNDQSQTVDDWFPMNGNVLLMHMNETSIKDSGTDPIVYDYSGNDFNGTFDASDDGLEKSTNGQLTKGLAFDGTNDVVSIPYNATLAPTSAISVSAWINTTNNTVGSTIVSKSDAGGYNLSLNIGGVCAASTLCWLVDVGGAYYYASIPSSRIQNSEWFHVMGTYDNETLRLFVNGVLVSSNTTPSGNIQYTRSNAFCIGEEAASITCDAGVDNFVGSLDEVAVWNRALSEDEVRKIYDHQSAKYSGTFMSGVIDTGSTSASWTTLAWNMIRPYGKELGASSDLSSSYTALPNDTLMSGSVLRMHFNETGEDTVGSGPTYDIEDFSSSDNHGNTTGTPTYQALGKFGYAMDFDGTDDYVTLTSATTLGSGDFSISLWFATHSNSRNVLISNFGGAGFYQIEINGTGAGTSVGTIGGTVDPDGAGILYAHHSNGYNDGEWHHVLFLRSGTNTYLYVDSVERASNLGSVVGSVDGTSTTIGKHGSLAYLYEGLLDEVAIWNRALSLPEIQELYRRGASRIRFQVRSCDGSGCDDEAWIVPDSTLTPYNGSGEFFSELHNTTTSNPSLTFGGFGSHTVANNQFFQWKAYLDTSNTSEIPELKSVTVGPTHYYGGNPTIVTSNALTFSSLVSFTETSAVGTIKYQLSNDGGTTWYWYNSAWTTTTSEYAEANSASDINANISSFPAGSGSLKVKAFLNSSAAAQATSLDTVSLQYVP